jgi:hypothetical protein
MRMMDIACGPPRAAMSRAGPSQTYVNASGIGLAASIDALGAVETVDAGSDEGELVAATPAPDGLAAPAQPTTAKTNTAIAAIDRFIG